MVVQRAAEAVVTIDGNEARSIGRGLVVLLGVEEADENADADWLINKISSMRIFADEEGRMNLSLKDIAGELMIISQFTLHASTKKGNRPSYIRAARPNTAIPLYNYFIAQAVSLFSEKVQTGEFGADMQVSLVNDGPVTIIMDSKNRE